MVAETWELVSRPVLFFGAATACVKVLPQPNLLFKKLEEIILRALG